MELIKEVFLKAHLGGNTPFIIKMERENKKVKVIAKQDIILSGKKFYEEGEEFEVEQFLDTYFLKVKDSEHKKFIPSDWITLTTE